VCSRLCYKGAAGYATRVQQAMLQVQQAMLQVQQAMLQVQQVMLKVQQAMLREIKNKDNLNPAELELGLSLAICFKTTQKHNTSIPYLITVLEHSECLLLAHAGVSTNLE
jgi:hypothetical protein